MKFHDHEAYFKPYKCKAFKYLPYTIHFPSQTPPGRTRYCSQPTAPD